MKRKANDFDSGKAIEELKAKVKKDNKLVEDVIKEPEKYTPTVTVKVENDVYHLRYKKRRTEDIEGVNWEFQNVSQTEWMGGHYNKITQGTVCVQTEMVVGNLDPIFEHYFKQECKDMYISNMPGLVDTIDTITRNYPHKEINTYARYLKYVVDFLRKKGFAENVLKIVVRDYYNKRVEGYMKMKKDEAVPVERAREEALMVCVSPTYNSVRKEMYKQVEKIENEDYALTKDFMKCLD